jgi:asparagine synthase (glutamine-hydrolysing)
MSMATSLEVRSPFLDHRLHEFAATLPDRAKIHGWTTKYLSRRLARRLLPEELLRRGKQGFVVPLDRWFRGELREDARQVLLDGGTRARGLFEPKAVEEVLARHASGSVAHGREIWMLMVVELWHRIYFDRTLSPPTGAEPVAVPLRD